MLLIEKHLLELLIDLYQDRRYQIKNQSNMQSRHFYERFNEAGGYRNNCGTFGWDEEPRPTTDCSENFNSAKLEHGKVISNWYSGYFVCAVNRILQQRLPAYIVLTDVPLSNNRYGSSELLLTSNSNPTVFATCSPQSTGSNTLGRRT